MTDDVLVWAGSCIVCSRTWHTHSRGAQSNRIELIRRILLRTKSVCAILGEAVRPGAQTERPGAAGPVSRLLGGAVHRPRSSLMPSALSGHGCRVPLAPPVFAHPPHTALAEPVARSQPEDCRLAVHWLNAGIVFWSHVSVPFVFGLRLSMSPTCMF